MNAKLAKMVEDMKKQTIGVEIEMAEITRQQAARVVAKYFGTERTVRHDGGSYDSWSCQDRQGRVWKITRDVSISASSDIRKAELGTPILTYNDLDDLQEIARQLRHAGAISNPAHGCGVHIHIGANGHTPASLRNLANLMASHESLLASALNLDRGRMGTYCKTVDPRFLEQLNREKPSTMAALSDVWYKSQNADYRRGAHYNSSRYHMLNLHATFTHGTVDYSLNPIIAGR